MVLNAPESTYTGSEASIRGTIVCEHIRRPFVCHRRILQGEDHHWYVLVD
jgi:hypothetical protein